MTTPKEQRPGLGKAARNEQVKITGTWLNGAAIAAVAIGCFAPITAVVAGTAPIRPPTLFALVACWLLVALVLHLCARAAVRGIEE